MRGGSWLRDSAKEPFKRFHEWYQQESNLSKVHQPLIPQTGLPPWPRGQKRGASRGTSCALQGCGCAGQVPLCKSLHRHEHACITNTSRHAASCWPRCKSLHKYKHACSTNTSTHAT
jgi:hypothetical protein